MDNGFHYEVRRAISLSKSLSKSQPKSQENRIIIHKKRSLLNQAPLLLNNIFSSFTKTSI